MTRKVKRQAISDVFTDEMKPLGKEKRRNMHGIRIKNEESNNFYDENHENHESVDKKEDHGTITDNDIISSQEDAEIYSLPNNNQLSNHSKLHLDTETNKDIINPSINPRIRSNEADTTVSIEVGFHRDRPILLRSKKEVKDSVHGVLTFEPLCMRIIDTFQFQRLRHLHQLGAANRVYIGATHTRFEHSLGVAHLAEKLVENLRQQQPWLPITDADALCIKIAGLCHDLGHGPFSHVYDGMFMTRLKQQKIISKNFKWSHERASVDMFEFLLQENNINVGEYGLDPVTDITFIKELILGNPIAQRLGRTDKNQQFLYDFINNIHSGLDVDKLDYFLRDAAHTGVKCACDVNLLIQNTRVLHDADDIPEHKLTVCYPEKLVGQVMQAFRTRFELHQAVYQHKSVRAMEYMICDALIAANNYITLRGNIKISEAMNSMRAYQHLDDRILARIEESESRELDESRKILMRIIQKPNYACVGKTKFSKSSGNVTIEEIAQEILSCCNKEGTKKNEFVRKNDIIVEIVEIHCGKEDRDPLCDVRFYGKNATLESNCFQIPLAAYENLAPKTFMDRALRVYAKQTQMIGIVRAGFELWSKKYNNSTVFPLTLTLPGVSKQ